MCINQREGREGHDEAYDETCYGSVETRESLSMKVKE